MATTLDLRGSGSTLRLGTNGGTASIRSFMVVGPTGATGPTGPSGPTGPAGPSGPTLPAAQVAALSATYVQFRDLAGNPVSGRVVTIVVDPTTNEVSDITVTGA